VIGDVLCARMGRGVVNARPPSLADGGADQRFDQASVGLAA
jgi:hypothetical protein